MKRFAIITLTAIVLASCESADYSQISTMRLCDNVLNYAGYVQYEDSQMLQNQRLEELSKRGEDCSDLMHLRRATSSDINVNVNQ